MWRAIGMLAICGVLSLPSGRVAAAARPPGGPTESERICGFRIPLPDGWKELERKDGLAYFGNPHLPALAKIMRFVEAEGADYAIPLMRALLGLKIATYPLVWLDHFAGEARIIHYFISVESATFGDRTFAGYSLRFIVLDQKPIGDLSPRGWWTAFGGFWVRQAEFWGMEATFIDMLKRFEFTKPEGVC